MKKYLVACLTMTLSSCWQSPVSNPESNTTQKESTACNLPSGRYPIQDATFNKTKNTYALVVLNAPGCVEQPVVVNQPTLGRTDEQEKEKAILVVAEATEPQLLMAGDYQLKMVETTMENGVEKTTEPSLWSPFLSSAAGAVVGGVVGGAIANKLMNKDRAPAPASQPPTVNRDQAKPSTPIYQRSKTRSARGGFLKKRRR